MVSSLMFLSSEDKKSESGAPAQVKNMRKTEGEKVAIFFTYGVGLKSWKEIGIYNRRKKFYDKYSGLFFEVNLVTYDTEHEAPISGNVKVLANSGNLPKFLYSFFSPFIHGRELSKTQVFETTQAMAWNAVLAKMFFRKPLVVRCGYEWSAFEKMSGNWVRYFFSKLFEVLVYKIADKVVVTSFSHRKNVLAVARDQRKVVLIPNGVDVQTFKPIKIQKVPKSLIFVGRLTKQKNLSSLIEAISGLDITLYIVGEGPLKEELKNLSREHGNKVVFLNQVPNFRLPEILNKYKVFVLPSLWEGHPKVLLEAMACGLPVIASKVSGNMEVVDDMKDGILCGTSPSELREKIIKLIKDEVLQKKLGSEARKKIMRKYSLDRQIGEQINVLRALL